MADSTQSGSKKPLAPAGAGFNLDQFKNEVANEIGMSLGRQGTFGQGGQNTAYGSQGGTFGSGATSSFGAQNAAGNFGAQSGTFGGGTAAGYGSQGAAGSYGAAQNTTGSYGGIGSSSYGAGTSSYGGGASSYGAGSAGQSPADRLSQSTSTSGLAAGASGTSAQTDFEVSSTLGQTSGSAQKGNSPAARVARQRGQSFNNKK